MLKQLQVLSPFSLLLFVISIVAILDSSEHNLKEENPSLYLTLSTYK